jgi:cysteine desulfuration protein SufE
MEYPAKLADIVDFFEALPDEEKRENLILYADNARFQGPKEGESFDLEDVRKDDECTDTVGVFLRVEGGNEAHFRVTLGPQVQTLTKAMTTILCKGLDGLSPEQVLEVPQDFVPKIVGAELVRARSQTVYYIISRMKGICKVFQDRKRAASNS